MLTYSRELRKNQTDAERRLWMHLRGRRLAGFKFKRQIMFKPYIVDFVCLERKLILELDGSQHQDAAEYDSKRTSYLVSLGFHVMRFWNNAIMTNLNGVLESVRLYLTNPHPLYELPSPTIGRGDNQ